VTGTSIDIQTIVKLRNQDGADQQSKLLTKQTIQCYTPSANFICKKRGQEQRVHLNPILQQDIDNLNGHDIDEVREELSGLPFVCFVGKSVSGNGLYALILIEEPERLRDYAEHLFKVFQYYGLPIDTTKGRNYTDLRFVSYDSKMFIRDYPKPLKIKRFNAPKITPSISPKQEFTSNSGLLRWAVNEIENAQVGQRFETVRRVAYGMGGHGIGLEEIKAAISNCSQYSGVESKYLGHADECFAAGKLKPIAA
jgi:hypothetical protein